MRLPSISNDQALIAWNSMRNHGSFDSSEIVMDYIGDDADGLTFSDIDLISLFDELLSVKAKYANKNKKNIGGLIDSDIIEVVHKTLTAAEASAFQLSQLGFWRWLSNISCNGALWDFVQWRFTSDVQVNWGITSPGSIIEVYFYRAWLRGHRMFDAKQQDPYKYAKLGSSDVWRSHILRQEFGRDREFVKAFLDTVYDPNGQTQIGTDELRKKFIPALRAWTSNSTFSHLTYSENLELIKTLRKNFE